jgi:hypothetical protein
MDLLVKRREREPVSTSRVALLSVRESLRLSGR